MGKKASLSLPALPPFSPLPSLSLPPLPLSPSLLPSPPFPTLRKSDVARQPRMQSTQPKSHPVPPITPHALVCQAALWVA